MCAGTPRKSSLLRLFFCGVRIFKKNRNTKFATNLALRSLVDSKRPQVILRNQAYLNHEAGAPQSQTKRFLKVLRSQTKCSSRKLSLPVANLRYRHPGGPPGPPWGSKPLYPPFWTPQGPRRPQEAPRESSGTIRTHTGPYGSIRIPTDPSQINFQKIFGHFWTNFGKKYQKTSMANLAI